MNCQKETKGRFISTKRMAPRYDAKECKHSIKKGQDNKMYISKHTGKQWRWVKITTLKLDNKDFEFILSKYSLQDSKKKEYKKKLKQITYNPRYKSKFGGNVMSADKMNGVDNAFFYQVSDRFAAHMKYGDRL